MNNIKLFGVFIFLFISIDLSAQWSVRGSFSTIIDSYTVTSDHSEILDGLEAYDPEKGFDGFTLEGGLEYALKRNRSLRVDLGAASIDHRICLAERNVCNIYFHMIPVNLKAGMLKTINISPETRLKFGLGLGLRYILNKDLVDRRYGDESGFWLGINYADSPRNYTIYREQSFNYNYFLIGMGFKFKIIKNYKDNERKKQLKIIKPGDWF